MKFFKNLLALNLILFMFISCNDDSDVVDPNNTAACSPVDFIIKENKGLDIRFEAEKKDGYTYTYEITQKNPAGETNTSKEVSQGDNFFVWGVGESEYEVCLSVKKGANDTCSEEKTCKTLIVTAKNIVDANKSETEKTEVIKGNDGKYRLRFLDKDGNVVE